MQKGFLFSLNVLSCVTPFRHLEYRCTAPSPVRMVHSCNSSISLISQATSPVWRALLTGGRFVTHVHGKHITATMNLNGIIEMFVPLDFSLSSKLAWIIMEQDRETGVEEILSNGQRGYLFTNWAKTFSCTPELFFVPESIEDIRQVSWRIVLAFNLFFVLITIVGVILSLQRHILVKFM